MEQLLREIERNIENILMMKIMRQLFDDKPLIFCIDRLEKLNKTLQGSDSDKVNCYLKLLKGLDLLPDAESLEEKKDDNISEEVRKEGNLFFASKPPKYLDALKAYNKSLCFAISKDNQCLALTNRSAVFFKMEMYKECLESIQLAREVGLLESVQEKVELRAKMCKDKLMEMPQEVEFILNVGMPVNEKMPFLAKCLELRENKEFGRHMITNEDIPAGTIIAIKEPFCKIVPNNEKFMRCTNCFGELTHLLMPCDTCTQAMFCSKECKEKANKDFHAIECPISGSLYKIFYNYYLLAFRMTIKAFLAFPDTETLAVALEKIDKEQKNVFSYDWSKELSQEDLYAPIRTLMAKAPDALSNGVYLGACLAFNLLRNNCPIFSQRYLTSSKADNLLKNLMCHHIRLVLVNSWSYGNLSISEDPRERFGTAICGFLCLMNHSCAPNVVPFITGATYGLVAFRNISKGTQLFVNYGLQHINVNRDERRELLSKMYAFNCQCEACVKDFPTGDALSMQRNIPGIPFPTKLAKTSRERLSVEFNKRCFKLLSEYIRKYSNFYPCIQLCLAQMEMVDCLQVLYALPLVMREKILNDQ